MSASRTGPVLAFFAAWPVLALAAGATGQAAMLRLPMSLLSTFLAPVLLAGHVWIFRRLAGRGTA